MNKTPPSASDIIMPIFRFALIFSFMLGFASIFAGIGYGIFTYATTELSFLSSMYAGLILFLKGAGLTAVISFISFMAFWKKHQIAYEKCQKSGVKDCNRLGFINFA